MRALALAALLAASGCIEDAKDEPFCIARQVVDCQCALGAAGFKTCNDQGTAFGVCMCQGGADAGLSDTGVPDTSVPDSSLLDATAD